MAEHTEPRYGALALALSLGVVVLADVIRMMAREAGGNADTEVYRVFFSFQVAAIVLGITARRTLLGKAAAITAAVLMVGSWALLA